MVSTRIIAMAVAAVGMATVMTTMMMMTNEMVEIKEYAHIC